MEVIEFLLTLDTDNVVTSFPLALFDLRDQSAGPKY